MFFVDILNILPEELDCFIGTYDLDDDIVLNLMSDVKNGGDFDKFIHLNKHNKKLFIERLTKTTIAEYFQIIEIKMNNVLLFKGYDGIESGKISKKITIPAWFKEKYKEDWDYSISLEW